MDGVQAVQGTSLEQPELDDDDDVDVVGPPPPPPPPPASRVRRLSTCLRSFFTHLFSNVGLLTLVGGYVLLGALLFEALEGGYEMNQRGSMKEHRDDCLKELWALTERFNVLYQENWTQQAQEQLRRFETRVVEATKVEGYDGKDPQDQDRQWSFSGALLYSVTVITTIGYGNLAPRTAEGKVVTMLYALVGVPLMLLCLSNLGSFLADTFQFAYSHACCKPCRGGGGGSSSSGGSTKKQMLQQQEMQQQQMVGYSGGSVSLGPPGSIACPPPHCPPHGLPPPGAAASTLPRVKACRDRPCAGSFGYFSGPVDWNLVGEQPGFFQDREREQQLHNTVVKQADNKVVTRLHHPPHITPDVHRLLTECIEYQVMHEEPGAAAALRELQSNPPAGPAPCSACAACAACSNCPAQHHDGGGGGAGLAALEEEPEDDDEDDEDHHHGDRSCGPHSTPSRVPLLCRSNSITGVSVSLAPMSTPVKRAPPPPPRRYALPGGKVYRGTWLQMFPPGLPPPPPSLVVVEAAADVDAPPPPPRVPVYLVLLGLAVYICLGAAVFAAWEEWSFLDGAYFCFVTLSTIGFGDLVPGKSLKSAESQGGQLQVSACVAYLLLGLVLIATAFSLVQEEVLARLSQVARTLGIISKHHQPQARQLHRRPSSASAVRHHQASQTALQAAHQAAHLQPT